MSGMFQIGKREGELIRKEIQETTVGLIIPLVEGRVDYLPLGLIRGLGGEVYSLPPVAVYHNSRDDGPGAIIRKNIELEMRNVNVLVYSNAYGVTSRNKNFMHTNITDAVTSYAQNPDAIYIVGRLIPTVEVHYFESQFPENIVKKFKYRFIRD